MAKEIAAAWLRQAASDLAAAEVFGRAEPGMACHIIAKQQQSVEKSVKAIVAALKDRGIINITTGFNHDVGKLVSAIVHLPRSAAGKDLQGQIAGLLNEHHRTEIAAISALAPRRPAPGQLARRNTEYPYQRADGSWLAPADDGGFSWKKDGLRFDRLARRIHSGSTRIVSALYR